jgi:hypothetical protein
MATTTNYGWAKPDVGGSNGAWGSLLNAIFDTVDTALHNVSVSVASALPLAGGVMTGRVDLLTTSFARKDKGTVSGAVALDLALAQEFSMTIGGATTFTVTNPAPGTVGQGMILRLVNPGSAALTWPVSFRWPGGTAPAFTASGTDVVVALTDDNGTTWHASIAMQNV